jgi:hypothetical protein
LGGFLSGLGVVFLFYCIGFMVAFLMDLTWYCKYISLALWWFSEWIWSGIIVLLWWIYGGTFNYFLLVYRMWLELMALGLV